MFNNIFDILLADVIAESSCYAFCVDCHKCIYDWI